MLLSENSEKIFLQMKMHIAIYGEFGLKGMRWAQGPEQKGIYYIKSEGFFKDT